MKDIHLSVGLGRVCNTPKVSNNDLVVITKPTVMSKNTVDLAVFNKSNVAQKRRRVPNETQYNTHRPLRS